MIDLAPLETACDTTSEAFKVALRKVQKSRSTKNRIAYTEASEAHQAACDALNAARDANQKPELRACRMAITERRRAERARQGELFGMAA